MFTIAGVISILLVGGLTTLVELEGKELYDTLIDCRNQLPHEERIMMLLLQKGVIKIPKEAAAAPEIKIDCYFMRRVG